MKLKEKICAFCGESFVPRSNFQKYCKKPHYMNCPVCGKKYLVTNNENLKRPPVACSYECRKVRREQTSIERYGIKTPGNNPEARKKSRHTCMEKYGVENVMQSEEFKLKAKNTLLENYGVDNPMKSETIKEKVATTNIQKYGTKSYLNSEQGKTQYEKIMIEKYGVKYPIQNEEIKNRIKGTNKERYGSEWFGSSEIGQSIIKEAVKARYGVDSVTQLESVKSKAAETSMKRYGVDNPARSKVVKDKIKRSMVEKYGAEGPLSVPEIRDKIMETTLSRYGVPFYVMLDSVKKSSGAISKLNKQFLEKLNARNLEAKCEFRIGSRSYDFYVPEFNLLVELNPSYTHNLIGNHWDNKGKAAMYHLDKCKLAHENNFNVRCIFDWDSEDNLLEELSSRRIEISNDESQVYKLNRKAGVDFLSRYGINRIAHYPWKTMFVGIVYQDMIESAVAICLNKAENSIGYQIYNYGIRWGFYHENRFTIIMNFVKQLIDLEDLSLCVDSDRFYWNDIEEMGVDITSIKYTCPNVYWSRKTDRVIHSRKKKPSDMLESGYLPVEDCGQAVFEYKK